MNQKFFIFSKGKIALTVLLILFWFGMAYADGISNVNKNGIGLEGYDPISYFKSKSPYMGSSSISYKYNNITYYFATEENRSVFMKSPNKYEPQFGGWCAYAIADSKSKMEIDPKSYLIQDGRLLLFYKGIWGDTREKWLHNKNKDTVKYLIEADANWPEVKLRKP